MRRNELHISKIMGKVEMRLLKVVRNQAIEESNSKFHGTIAQIISSHEDFLFRCAFRRLAGEMDPGTQDQI